MFNLISIIAIISLFYLIYQKNRLKKLVAICDTQSGLCLITREKFASNDTRKELRFMGYDLPGSDLQEAFLRSSNSESVENFVAEKPNYCYTEETEKMDADEEDLKLANIVVASMDMTNDQHSVNLAGS